MTNRYLEARRKSALQWWQRAGPLTLLCATGALIAGAIVFHAVHIYEPADVRAARAMAAHEYEVEKRSHEIERLGKALTPIYVEALKHGFRGECDGED